MIRLRNRFWKMSSKRYMVHIMVGAFWIENHSVVKCLIISCHDFRNARGRRQSAHRVLSKSDRCDIGTLQQVHHHSLLNVYTLAVSRDEKKAHKKKNHPSGSRSALAVREVVGTLQNYCCRIFRVTVSSARRTINYSDDCDKLYITMRVAPSRGMRDWW